MAEEWHRRIEANEPWVLHWLEHQTEDAYWRRASVWFDDADAIQAATLVIAGHADGYRNMAFRTFERLRGPKAILFGPWSHMSPRLSIPGPRIDHVPVMIAWWQRWLGEDPSVDVGPRDRSRPPMERPRARPGHGERRVASRPACRGPARRRGAVARVAVGARGRAEPGVDRLAIRGDVGVTGSIWCAGVQPFGLPWDQRPDEAFSLVYDWPVKEELEIMGRPVELRVASVVAFVSAKLCDVAPDGRSGLVTRGILNLTHRDSHERPESLDPGVRAATIELDATAYVFEPGHRIRLDLAPSDFPSSWPPPLAGELLFDREASTLVLPVVDGPPVAPPPVLGAHGPSRRVRWGDVVEDVLAEPRRPHRSRRRARAVRDRGRLRSVLGRDRRACEPRSAWASAGRRSLAWDEAEVRNEARAELRSDATTWTVAIDLEVFDGDERIAERHWERTIPRELG